MERMFDDDRHKDFTIICRKVEEGEVKEIKEIKVHKVVLAARSPVFSAIFEPHTDEAKSGEVVYDDVDYDVFFVDPITMNQ